MQRPPSAERDKISLIEILLWHRNRCDDTPPISVTNPIVENLLAHRSVRAFKTDTLPSGTLELLVAAAQSASTSSNLQTWSVVAVSDQGRRDRLSKIAGDQSFIGVAPLFLIWLADLSRVERIGSAHATTLEGLAYLEALILGTIDASLAAQNAVVALESLGLASVFVGAIRNDIESVARELRLPRKVAPIFGLCVGYADDKVITAIKPRLPPKLVLHHERYSIEEELKAIAGYDKACQEFQLEQNMQPVGWSRKVIERLRTESSLTGRHMLRTALQRLGFELL